MGLSCTQCGLIGSVVDTVCRRCGTPLSTAATPPNNNPNAVPPPWQLPPDQPQYPAQPPQPQSQPETPQWPPQQQQQWPQPSNQQLQPWQQPWPQQYQPPNQPQPNYYQQPIMVNQGGMPMPYREIKNPGLAAILSFFIPGLGQLYNGQIGKGIMMFFGTIFLLFFFVGLGVYVWSIVDAYSTAKKINTGLLPS